MVHHLWNNKCHKIIGTCGFLAGPFKCLHLNFKRALKHKHTNSLPLTQLPIDNLISHNVCQGIQPPMCTHKLLGLMD